MLKNFSGIEKYQKKVHNQQRPTKEHCLQFLVVFGDVLSFKDLY